MGQHHVIQSKPRTLDGIPLRRLLPSAWRSIGPFVFLDHLGPAPPTASRRLDVRPHPHIHLATVTYLFAGELMHRDSLGTEQLITPGAVNWMTAGRGIVHSERSPESVGTPDSALHALQLWVALPQKFEDVEPAFHHYPKATLPCEERPGLTIRVLAGSAFGLTSPVHTYSQLCFAHLQFAEATTLEIAPAFSQRCLYVVDGQVDIDGQSLRCGDMAILASGQVGLLRSHGPARVAYLAGEPLDGPRHLWWNFVSSSRERIEQAKQDWRNQRFATIPGDSDEYIPLPEHD